MKKTNYRETIELQESEGAEANHNSITNGSAEAK